jgi:hypothetical protein
MSDLTILMESASCRLALCRSDDGASTMEVLLLIMRPGEADLPSLRKALALLQRLEEMGFRLTFQDEGWISCERSCPSPQDAPVKELMGLLDGSGFS